MQNHSSIGARTWANALTVLGVSVLMCGLTTGTTLASDSWTCVTEGNAAVVYDAGLARNVFRLVSDPDAEAPTQVYGNVLCRPLTEVTWANIRSLQATFKGVDGSIRGGTPRFSIWFLNGEELDETRHLFALWGDPEAGYTDFYEEDDDGVRQWQTGVEFIDTDLGHHGFEVSQLSSMPPAYDHYGRTVDLVGTRQVGQIGVILDGSWFQRQEILIDTIQITGLTGPSAATGVLSSRSMTSVSTTVDEGLVPFTEVFRADQPPVAQAGPDQITCVGRLVTLDGSASFDPNPDDRWVHAWTLNLEAVPGSRAVLLDADSATPSFTPDVPGIYRVALVVTDLSGWQSEPATVFVRAEATGDWVVVRIMTGVEQVTALLPGQVTSNIDKMRLVFYLEMAAKFARKGLTRQAGAFLSAAIERTDGFVLRGAIDRARSRFVKDTVIDPGAQKALYALLDEARAALQAIPPAHN